MMVVNYTNDETKMEMCLLHKWISMQSIRCNNVLSYFGFTVMNYQNRFIEVMKGIFIFYLALCIVCSVHLLYRLFSSSARKKVIAARM